MQTGDNMLAIYASEKARALPSASARFVPQAGPRHLRSRVRAHRRHVKRARPERAVELAPRVDAHETYLR